MPDFKRPTKTPDPDRPPIWVDGRQQPRFDLRAWGRVGHAMTRRWLVPNLDAASTRLATLGGQISGGRFPMNLSWLGRVERHVPDRQAISRTVAGLALRVAEARLILAPEPEADEPIAYPDLIRPEPAAPVATVSPSPAPRPNPAAVDPTLSAIRAILHTHPVAEATPAAPVSNLPTKQPKASGPGLFLARTLSHLIAWGSLALSLPVGLTQALLFHLDGGDLADWE